MTTIKLRRDTNSNWISVNPILAQGEVGLITDTNKYIVGDGTSTFSNLTQYNNISEAKLHALKGYEDVGELLTDAEGLADVTTYAHSTFDLSKFTVVGTPTISADGVASGFSDSDYVKITSISATGTIEKVSAKFIINETNTINDVIFRSGSTWVYLNRQVDGKKFSAKQPSQYGLEYLLTNFVPVANTWYIAELILNKETQKLTVKCYFNGTEVATATVNSTLPTLFSTDLIIGQYTNSGLLGSVDLNAFKIYVDGDLVYQPCLKIPYTLSKTGSKVVDSVYRNRVNDCAEQFGQANYYTLSDTDFTLPQGEVYGMIGQRTLRETYRNGIFYYDLYSDRTLEQGGSCTSGTDVTFLKPFSDTNYVLTVPYSAKTTTGFTPSQTGDWIAKGIGEL